MEDAAVSCGDSHALNSSFEEFDESEKILAYHQSLIYEAKIIKKETRGEQEMFLIHYQGWKDRWDEWVDSSRIMKYNNENRKFAEDLKTEFKKLVSKVPPFQKSKKRKTDFLTEENPRQLVVIELPQAIRKRLLQDSDYISQKFLVTIPKSPSVTDIFNNFIASCSTLEKDQQEKLREGLNGIKLYFNQCLGHFLLYRFEKRQYCETLKLYQTKSIVDLYGIEHLLRFLVIFPHKLHDARIEGEALQILRATTVHLITHLVKNLSELVPSYEAATPPYIRLAS